MKKEEDNSTDKNRIIKIILTVLLLGALFVINYYHFSRHISSNSEKINDYTVKDDDMDKFRPNAVAGLFYPAASGELDAVVGQYLSARPSGTGIQPKILIVPHAGYKYSAQTAARAYVELLPWKNKIHNVILLGPSHYVGLKGAALSKDDYFTTPLGQIAINKEINSKLAALPGFSYNNAAHAKEHSLEVQLPFLQKILKNFTIVPIVYGNADSAEIAQALEPYLKAEDTLLVVSADLSHYYAYEDAKKLDGQTGALVESQLPVVENHMSCGATGINTAIILAQQNRMMPKLLDMVNSGDVTGEKSSVVGYASWLFGEDENKKETKAKSVLEQEVENINAFAEKYGKDLLKIAKISLDEAVLHRQHFKPSRDDYPDVLFDKGATFVTLEKEGELRGCIGSLLPAQAVAYNVAQNAYAAALEDNRFPPVKPEELEKIKISISLLTGFEPVNYKSEEDLAAQLVKGVDGVILRDGNRQGVFLPAVWKQLPDPQEFLNNLKIKAGMSPSYWSNRIKIYRFRGVEISKNEN